MANLYRVKSFSKHSSEGNLAGVVLNAQDLSVNEMLAIAKEVGAAETAFILPSSKADLRIRWFTPNTEVGMCVHATIAALAIYKKHFSLSSAFIEVETKNIKLLCQIREDDIFVKVSGYYLLPRELDCNQISSLLSINSTRIVSNPCIVKIFDDAELIIEIASFRELSNLAPTQKTYSEICHLLNVTGISIFTRETLDANNHTHTREFAPLYGYLEDPLCGMAAGAIGCYLQIQEPMRVEQGYFCNTTGVIKIEPETSGSYWIGGSYCILEN